MVVEAAEAAGQEIEEAEVSRPDPDSREAEVPPIRRRLLRLRDNIRGQSILTSRQDHGQGARCILAGGRLHFSVRNHPHAPGKTFSSLKLLNETVTSSA